MEVKSQIHYAKINQRYRNAIQYSKVCPSAECGMDHRQVICQMRTKLKKLIQPRNNVNLQFSLQHKDLKVIE